MRQYYPISICIACMMHFVWATGLWLDPSVVAATSVHAILLFAHDPDRAAVIFAGAALLAILGLLLSERWWRVLCILPQQVILWFSIVGAANAMLAGGLGDSVERTRWFVVVDQVPVMLIAFGHFLALILIADRVDDRG